MQLKVFKLFTILFVAGALVACQPKTKPESNQEQVITGQQLPNPDWVKDAVLYEVNIRQYTPEGTFEAFAEHLPRLKDLGVDILWIMPIHPISEKNRKGTLGSYYAVKDYKGINPEFGTMADFKNLVSEAHDLGFKVIIDWVANHTGWDNQWIFDHPEWYTKDSTGAIIAPNPDWSDIADLNFDVQPMRRAMIDAMDFWLEEANIDGFRCDVAWGVPQDFWEEARASFDSIKPIYMLAEDEDHPGLLKYAFESNYTWKLHHTMNAVAKGEQTAQDLRNYFVEMDEEKYTPGSFPMQFITNHDENSWAGTVNQRMGDAADAFAAFSFTVPGIPLIYSGQEAGLDKQLAFFEKDEIDWSKLDKEEFYRRLIELKKTNEALWNGLDGGDMKLLNTNHNDQVFAFTREKNSNKLLIIMNLSDRPVVSDIKFDVHEEYDGIWEDSKLVVEEKESIELQAWEYKIYRRL
ncbi:alpha-amylase family glycosyl hydrolase [Sunxiuqinia elliptica]|uniref:1,4-alpha-glucan branching enzyme n=1 Tax=Sunxiuqinia elliptica TaxID=655355 RepID=A0A4R6H1R8_9BACT|nr:alpha-amylase family glycosyl hydrolase [Sunxiuqinia elliptica]TDO01311.1 1,4-alpha-glucan branching enzyme [Sunxiuqinia elliptica]TDO57822.1 1,4-alpha-glucan branching enzyme [Sunxiuqinia elliptica]